MMYPHCPDCNDPVRLPQSASPDLEVRCPMCGSLRSLGDYLRQLPPMLEVIGEEHPAQQEAYALGQMDLGLSGESHASAMDDSFSVDSAYAQPLDHPDPMTFDDQDDVPRPAAFDSSASGIKHRRSRRRGPSIFKMLFQWFGGGALGIGGALAILYFVFPDRYPEFLPFQPNSSTTNETSSPTQGGFTDEFVPRSASRDGTGSSFVSANENAHLLESMNVGQPASSDNEPPKTIVEPSVPETSIPESPPEGTIFLEKHDAVLAALEQKKQSPPKDLKRRTAMLYRALAELGHTTIDNHTVQTRKRAGKLLGDISEPKTVQELEQLIPLWLSRSQVSDGFVAVGTVGTRITPEARSGFSSVELKWHGSDSTPITILGLTNELSKLRGKRVITIGALERSVSGIAKSGKVMEVAAIHTLPSP